MVIRTGIDQWEWDEMRILIVFPHTSNADHRQIYWYIFGLVKLFRGSRAGMGSAGDLGSAVSWGRGRGAPAEIEFGAFLTEPS